MPDRLESTGRYGGSLHSRLSALSWGWRLALLAYSLLAVCLILQGIGLATQGGDDFQWDSAYLLLHRQNPYLVSHELTLHPRQGPVVANQLPSALMLLWGYALFPYDVARYLWIATNLLCTAGIARELYPVFLHRKGHWWEVLFVFSLLAVSHPWQATMVLGQHPIVALYFFLLSVRLAQQGRAIGSGLALALSFVKYTVTAPLALYFLYKRWYKPLAISGLLHVALHFVAAVWLGDSPLELVRQSTELSRGLAALGYIDPFAVWQRSRAVFPLLASIRWWPYLLTVVLGIVALIFMRRRRLPDPVVLTAVSFLSVMLMYHRAYDLAVLILPFFVLLYRRQFFDRWLVIGLAFSTGYILYVVRAILLLENVPPLMSAVPALLLSTFWIYAPVCYATLFYLTYRALVLPAAVVSD